MWTCEDVRACPLPLSTHVSVCVGLLVTFAGIAILFLDGWLVVMCVYETSVYVRQLLDLGPKLWGSMASNWINITCVALQATLVVGHLQM